MRFTYSVGIKCTSFRKCKNSYLRASRSSHGQGAEEHTMLPLSLRNCHFGISFSFAEGQVLRPYQCQKSRINVCVQEWGTESFDEPPENTREPGQKAGSTRKTRVKRWGVETQERPPDLGRGCQGPCAFQPVGTQWAARWEKCFSRDRTALPWE